MKKNSINTILDFGCGNGEMLEVFDSKLNKTVKGLEPENSARLTAQKISHGAKTGATLMLALHLRGFNTVMGDLLSKPSINVPA